MFDENTIRIPDGTPPLLDRKQMAELLTQLGFRIAPTTLAKLAVVGGGPEYIKFGRWVKYRPQVCLVWATSKCRQASSTTSTAA